MIVLKRGISAEAKVGGYPVTSHQFRVISAGGENFRIDVGELAGTNRKRIFSISSEGRVVKIGVGYLEADAIFGIAQGLVAGSEPVSEIRFVRAGGVA